MEDARVEVDGIILAALVINDGVLLSGVTKGALGLTGNIVGRKSLGASFSS